ncbi:hypothetical protein ACP3TJ_05100 [Desulforudis sp. 1088]|uniref:hypothetical protein n=1 Tax=unclassified Candidatus Desulforudis TaxID=2635950 RepID=UPI00348F9229
MVQKGSPVKLGLRARWRVRGGFALGTLALAVVDLWFHLLPRLLRRNKQASR